jgi:hypothetical protein
MPATDAATDAAQTANNGLPPYYNTFNDDRPHTRGRERNRTNPPSEMAIAFGVIAALVTIVYVLQLILKASAIRNP